MYLKNYIRTLSFKVSSLTLCVLFSGVAHADKILEAYKQKDRAYNRYYRALTELPHPPTNKERQQLKKKIIRPAELHFATVFNSEMQNFLKSQNLKLAVNYPFSKHPLSNPGSGQNQPSSRKPETKSKKPEIRLDGKKVPKLLEFPGKKDPSSDDED